MNKHKAVYWSDDYAHLRFISQKIYLACSSSWISDIFISHDPPYVDFWEPDLAGDSQVNTLNFIFWELNSKMPVQDDGDGSSQKENLSSCRHITRDRSETT